MASLFTNASAQTALQTLTAASKNLATTQSRVSTGYRINTAEDNAAYWSIATTLRSDVNALGAVQDALGLGAATIDTVYTGLNDTKDLLDQIKSKLVAASQPGVPRKQIQAEITQLQNRLNNVSGSTVINSESWLTQDSSVDGYNNVKKVVGSFTRSGGVVTIDTINVDINDTKLYETSKTINTAVEGSLNSAGAGTTIGKYTTAVQTANATASAQATAFETLILKYDASTDELTLGAAGAPAGVDSTTAPIGSGASATALSIDIDTTGGAGVFLGAEATAALQKAINAELSALGTFSDDADATNGTGALKKYTNVGGTVDLTSTQDAEIAKLVADTNTRITNLITDALNTAKQDAINLARTEYETAATGDVDNAKLGIFDKVRTVVSSSDGTSAKAVSVSNIDISGLTDTDFDLSVLSAYVSAVDDALSDLTYSASVVGAAKARIEGNKTFVKNLIDANNRGIGQLVDADLNEESTKLKALQVQEQLAIQALGIANSSTQNILSLFQ
ncbi:MAG: flagellin [Pseudochelatococcus sp.]|jgi:flagellin|uniref:flagellin N-terminal helical domain-containing protein n=1 Tax=Pseudochelatococcus sp. TaxID=2020869 RepID=UPI003D8D91F2